MAPETLPYPDPTLSFTSYIYVDATSASASPAGPGSGCRSLLAGWRWDGSAERTWSRGHRTVASASWTLWRWQGGGTEQVAILQ